MSVKVTVFVLYHHPHSDRCTSVKTKTVAPSYCLENCLYFAPESAATQDIKNYFRIFDNNINEQIPLSSSSIPMTTILPIQTESRTDVWISRLPNTPSLTEADYESQV